MKRAVQWITISAIVCGMLLALGRIAIQHIERESSIGLAAGELRQLAFALRGYAQVNEGKSPVTLQNLIDGGFLSSDVFEYNGMPRCGALEFPKLVHEGLVTSEIPAPSTILARQKWSDHVELVLYASGKVGRKRSQ